MRKACHFSVNGRHHLIRHFNQCGFYAKLVERFHHFQTYETTANDRSVFNFVGFDRFNDAIHIWNIAQRVR